jgi:hypothetical protein
MPRAPDLAGSVLDGRYELEALIGEGAFGRVYRGVDRRLGRAVAVKVIKPWWADDPSWAESFEREARLLARVSDPGIVQIFDVGYEHERLYYVAELVDGESLASRLRRGPLPPWQACQIAEQLCRALGQAHAQRVVHRDLKPANVLISSRGRVKLGDFGVARLADGSTDGLTGTVVGTPRYMAPEQARGARATAASDVYSVGVMVYEMLAGEPPFDGDSVVELALRHARDVPPPLPASTPAALADVVERALAKDPVQRYSDAGAMADALARVRRAHGARDRAAATRAGPPRPRPPAGGRLDRTRVAPRFTPRRNVSPAARRQTIAAFGLVLTVLLAMTGAAFVLAAPERVRMPDVRGLSRSAIQLATKRLGVAPLFSSRYDSAAPGVAIGQTPQPAAWVNKGSTVQIVLSEGPPPVKVPRLIDETSTSARAILESLGLSLRISWVPAPGVQPGVVTGQTPAPGDDVAAHGSVALSVAETPSWRPGMSLAGKDGGGSAAFRIRGDQWRIVYSMSYVGTCTLLFFCDGPTAHVININTGATTDRFDLNDGDNQTYLVRSGPGTYRITITPGSDTAAWSLSAQDYY